MKVEDQLVNYIHFGTASQEQIRERQHVPHLWEIAHDLEGFIKSGKLVEIASEYSLADIFEYEKFRNTMNSPSLKLDELEHFDKTATIQFKTPDGAIYELFIGKTERTPFHGHFKRI